VRIDAAATRRHALRVSGIEVDGVPAWDAARFDEGFWGPEPAASGEPGSRWTHRAAEVRVAAGADVPKRIGDPAAGAYDYVALVNNDAVPEPGWLDPRADVPKRIGVRLSAESPRSAVLSTGGEPRTVVVGREPAWFVLDLPDAPHDVVNNAGSNLYDGGYGGDRGYLERDEGQYDDAVDVFAWCGGSVLLRPAYLRDVGLFDERFFLYYEDTDLSWRGRLLGWRYRYVPGSVVRHEHAATSGEGSDVFRYFVQRNRLLMLAKDAPVRLAARAALVEARSTARSVSAEFLRPMARLQRPRPNVGPQQVRSMRSFVKHLPAMVADRRRLGRRRVVSDAEILGWMVTK
jgi:hypothetical protein